MKKLLVLIFIAPAVLFLRGQNLPDEYIISSDGRRLTRGKEPVSGLYDPLVVKRIDLTFSQSNWQNLLSQNYNSKTDIPATLTMDGKAYPNVGVRYKGQTSYLRVSGDKKSFNITLDYEDSDQNLKGYETLNFNNSFEDNSFIREVFYENSTREYGPSLKASFINLFINGVNWGLYPHVQNLDGNYIKEWFLSNDGARWRCERISGSGPGTGGPGGQGSGGGFGAGTSTLNYLGEDTSLYKPHYTLKKSEISNPWFHLMRTTKVLSTFSLPDSLNQVLDVDRTLWFLAKEILFGDDDSYVNKGGMDYYAYYDVETGRLIPLEYDANTVMQGQTGQWSIFLKENDVNYPLCNKLFKSAELRQRYLAHVRTMTQDLFTEAMYAPLIDRYFSLIDTLVQNDTKKLMTYNQFVAGKEGLKSWLNSRRNFILNNSEVNRTGALISNTEYRTGGLAFKTPGERQPVSIRTKISGKSVKSVYVYYGSGYDGTYTRLAMYDDGIHGDDLANDGLFAAVLPGGNNGVFVRYYIEAIANDGFGTATFDPQGAENDVYIYRVNLEPSANQGVVINEVMSANTNSVADQDDEYDDWIELYNTTNATIDLSRWILTDNPDNLDKYRIPQGTIIPSNGYLIVWADEDGKQQGLHANFKLSASGEPLILLDSTGQMVDSVEIPALQDDVAYARQPNGMGAFVIKAHTFNKNNDGTTPLEFSENKEVLRVYPNPSKTNITLEWTGKPGQDIRIYNLMGQLVHDCSLDSSLELNVSQWAPGTYFIKVGNQMTRLIIQ